MAIFDEIHATLAKRSARHKRWRWLQKYVYKLWTPTELANHPSWARKLWLRLGFLPVFTHVQFPRFNRERLVLKRSFWKQGALFNEYEVHDTDFTRILREYKVDLRSVILDNAVKDSHPATPP